MAYKNGKVYIDYTTTPKTGINTHDISQAVNYSSGDFGVLIENGTINVYNIHKPVRSAQKDDLTDADFKSDDICLGFDRLSLISQNIAEIFSIAKEKKSWSAIYKRPRGIAYNDQGGVMYTEMYRPNDFNGYDKNAVQPYTYQVTSSIVTYRPVADLKKTQQTFNFTINSASETPITAFSVLTSGALGYAQTLDQYRYGIAYRKQTASGWGEIHLALGNQLDAANAPAQSVGITFVEGTGTYELCFVATRETSSEFRQLATAWLDKGFFSLNVSARRIPIDVDMVNFSNLIRAQKTFDDMGYKGITLFGFTEIRNFTCRAIIPQEATGGVVSTNGGLEVYVIAMNNDGDIIGQQSIDLDYDSFEYSGQGEKTLTVDTPSDPLLNQGVFSPEMAEYDRIDYLIIRVTPYTNTTEDNNGEFRWANGATSQEYRVDFIH